MTEQEIVMKDAMMELITALKIGSKLVKELRPNSLESDDIRNCAIRAEELLKKLKS